MSDLLDRLKTALADRYAIERERPKEERPCPRDLKASQTALQGSDTTPLCGFRSLRVRLIPFVAVVRGLAAFLPLPAEAAAF